MEKQKEKGMTSHVNKGKDNNSKKNKKGHEKKKKGGHQKIKMVKMDKMMTFLSVMMNHLSLVFGSGTHEELIGRYKASSISEPTKFSLTKSFVHNTSRDFFGTNIQKMKFHSLTTAIGGGAGILTSVMRLRASDLAYFNAFSGIFDEYRFGGPIAAHYYPQNVSATGVGGQIYGVGVLDLVDSTVLASIAGALMYDTAKIFALTVPYSGEFKTSWNTHLLGNPDNIWLDTSSQATDVAWFKTYNYLGVTGTVAYGSAAWVVEIDFRQLYGI